MCGIFGFLKENANSSDNQKLLRECTDILKHRGPDDSVYYNDPHCGLGMRRLSIIDLTLGIYPLYNEAGTKLLIYNGEIYNYRKLRGQLKSLGYKFKTDCDGEVIIFGYEKWGAEVFKKLQGMYAIAIWDKTNKKLVLARDRIGIKPLYYTEKDKEFYFSSEVKALLNLRKDNKKFQLDYDKVKTLLGFMFLPDSENTIIKGIKKVPPGTYLEITKNKISPHKYWNLSDTEENRKIGFDEACEKLEELLLKTVGQHLISDVPVGVMLSGGIDSSLLAAIIAKNKLLNEVKTYTARFDHPFNESEGAKRFAEELGTSHHEIPIDVSKINRDIEKYIDTFDDLTTFDGGLITTRILSEEINKRGIKVLLLGEGADEILGGYSWFGISKFPLNLLPKYLRSSIYYYAISRNITKGFGFYAKYLNSTVPSCGDVFNEICFTEMTTQLPNHLLMKVDKASMAASIEARVPYLDHKLVEFIYSLPSDFKLSGIFPDMRNSREKYILRQISKRYLPEYIVNRKKKGFLLPMRDVLASDINKVKDYILKNNSASLDILDIEFRKSLFEKSDNKYLDMQKEYFTWRLFLLEVWTEKNRIT
ncbi:asparagine synthase (glutamine-hydrolyzing) [Patescibacteria group bacterium]|nr:asparagine synthase (glutamine-hydrolyzing) [Patescibacteria group bacterium]